MKAGLTALAWDGEESWESIVQSALINNDFQLRRHQGGLQAWTATAIRDARDGIRYTDGWRIRRLWLGRRKAIAFIPNRFFFVNGESAPTQQPWAKLFPGFAERPEPAPALSVLRGTLHVMDQVAEADVGLREQVSLSQWFQ